MVGREKLQHHFRLLGHLLVVDHGHLVGRGLINHHLAQPVGFHVVFLRIGVVDHQVATGGVEQLSLDADGFILDHLTGGHIGRYTLLRMEAAYKAEQQKKEGRA